MVAAITLGVLPRKRAAAPTTPAPVAVAPAHDLGDYGDPAFLDGLAVKQLEAELLSQIVTVRRLVTDDTMPAFIVEQEKAKGAALRAAWERRGKTIEDLRGKSPEFKGIN